jgi:flagellar hook-associated protein 1 FlgK
MTSFSGLTNALQALNSASYALGVTGQNIANADTDGYTRQRAELSATGPAASVSTMYATPNHNGTVSVTGTSRLNDPVVDARARTEHGRNGSLQANSTTLSSVESLFDEPSDNGLAEQMTTMWKSWSAVANNPSDPAARNVVLQDSAGVATTLNTTSAALADVKASVTSQLNVDATQVNTATTALAQVNGDIAVATATGADSNSLADQRDGLLMTLSTLTGAQSTINANGTATVTIGGQTVVSSVTATAVSLDASNNLQVGGTPAGPIGGSMQGLQTGLNTTIPNYQAQLDAVASALASTANAAQAAGYTVAGAAGGPLFTGTTASTIAVAVTDPAALAASGTPGGNLDGSVALTMSELGNSTTGADAQYRSMIGQLGTESATATQQASVQDSVTTGVDSLAQQSSGVSLDEETTNLLTYQRSYSASARVLTTVDDMLDTLISHTGRVGLA